MTDIDTVRLLISDLGSGDDQIFTDAEITAFLTLEGDAVKLAAAQALDSIASNEAQVSKRIRTLDLQTDGPAVAKELRAHATALRAQHAAAVDADTEAEFEFTTDLGRPAPLPEWTDTPVWI